jgi:hypothetical protein
LSRLELLLSGVESGGWLAAAVYCWVAVARPHPNYGLWCLEQTNLGWGETSPWHGRWIAHGGWRAAGCQMDTTLRVGRVRMRYWKSGRRGIQHRRVDPRYDGTTRGPWCLIGSPTCGGLGVWSSVLRLGRSVERMSCPWVHLPPRVDGLWIPTCALCHACRLSLISDDELGLHVWLLESCYQTSHGYGSMVEED